MDKLGWACGGCVMTYRSRTKNAKMTVAFSRSLMRSDYTNSSEIP
jgi:hypothetical protein